MINNGPYTPGGMIYKQQWGPARHAMNAAFIASQAKVINHFRISQPEVVRSLGFFRSLQAFKKSELEA